MISVGMLALGAEPTSALFLTKTTEPPADKVELVGQEPLTESIPLSGQIGYNFTIRNDSGLKEEKPSIAYSSDRQEYLVVWYNDRPGNDDIRGQRVSKNGGLVGGPFYISAGAGADRSDPDVTYNSKSQEYLVVWRRYESAKGYSIQGRRVSANGQVLGNADIIIRDFGYNFYTPNDPAVAYASTSDKYIVVWDETFHPLPIQRDILGRVVSSSGTPEGSQFVISKDPGNIPRDSPDLAYNRKRNEYLVVWQQYYSSSLDDVIGRRVTGGGVPLNPADIFIHSVSVSSNNPSVAALPDATADGQYLVVFELQYNPGEKNIYSRFVSGKGVVGSGKYIAWSLQDETHPAISGSEVSNQYLVAWSRPSSPPWVFNYIAGRYVSTTGAFIGGEKYIAGFTLADHAVISSGPSGDFLVAFKDQQPPSVDSGIYGQLWGNRIYLPLTLRNH
jgi:hypothetical protein